MKALKPLVVILSISVFWFIVLPSKFTSNLALDNGSCPVGIPNTIDNCIDFISRPHWSPFGGFHIIFGDAGTVTKYNYSTVSLLALSISAVLLTTATFVSFKYLRSKK